jgi:hypothetical protein
VDLTESPQWGAVRFPSDCPYEKSNTASTSVRILGEKDPQTRPHKEQEAIGQAKNVLQDLIHWPERRTDDDQAFAGPLEALLAPHPKILVGSADKKTTKASVGAKREARARVNIGHPKARLVAGLNIGWKSDRTKESAVERTGYEHQKVVDVSDQATHRATVEGNLGLATKGLSPAAGESHTTLRTTADDTLRGFEANLRNARHDRTVQYNIKYEMQSLSSGWLDACLAIEVLAAKAGDDRGAAAARETAQQLLQSPANWSPKNMTVRRKVKEARRTGLNFVARIQKSAGSEAQRADWRFRVEGSRQAVRGSSGQLHRYGHE